MLSNTCFRISAKLAATSFVALALHGQTTKVIDVNEPRPLWSALDRLEIEYPGVAINYEDPPYENLADVQDSATPQQQAAHPGFHLIVPRAGYLSAEISTSSTGDAVADVVASVNALLVSYRQNALPGDFKVEQANGMVYVTPIAVSAANGSSRDVTSPLTALISIPDGRRTLVDTLQVVLEAMSKATGLRIGLATLPFQPKQQVTLSATNEPARDVLARLFALADKRPVSYRFIYEPKPDLKRTVDYMVNIHPAGFVPPQAPVGLGPISVGPAAPPAAQQTPTGTRPGMTPAKQ